MSGGCCVRDDDVWVAGFVLGMTMYGRGCSPRMTMFEEWCGFD